MEIYILAVIAVLFLLFSWFYYRVNRKKLLDFDQRITRELKIDPMVVELLSKHLPPPKTPKQNIKDNKN